MNKQYGAISFRQVLPSAFLILIFGALLSLFSAPWQWLGPLSGYAILVGLIFGGCVYLIGFLVSCSPWYKTRSMHELLTTLQTLFNNFTWPQIIVVSLLAGVGEELLIRGVLQTFLIDNVGTVGGIIGASLIFGLLHYMTKTYVILTFALGLMFGIAFHYSNSMLLVMIGHTVYDIIAFTMIIKYPHFLGLQTPELKGNSATLEIR